MKVFFRVDGSDQIGTGHVMRCLALADYLSQKQMTCQFICRDHKLNLIPLLEQKGYVVHRLPYTQKNQAIQNSQVSHAQWLGSTQLEDAEQTLAVLNAFMVDWIIVDHYAIDHVWENKVASCTAKIMVIDDLADRKHKCNLLLDQTFGRDVKDYETLCPNDCGFLIGSRYALLRSEFSEFRASSIEYRRTYQKKSILITMGGLDSDNRTLSVLKVISMMCAKLSLKVTVVLGAGSQWFELIDCYARRQNFPVTVKQGVNNMAELMSGSDICIGAAGSTSWERCCVGLPSITIVIADNQEKIAECLEEFGATIVANLGDLELKLKKLLDEGSEVMEKISQQALTVCDGLGVERVYEYIKNEY